MFHGSIVQVIMRNLTTDKKICWLAGNIADWNNYNNNNNNYNNNNTGDWRLESSLCRGEVDGGGVGVPGFLSDAAARELLGHRVPELGVGDGVDQRVETAGQLGWELQNIFVELRNIFTGWSTLIGRGMSSLCSDWLDHDVTPALLCHKDTA